MKKTIAAISVLGAPFVSGCVTGRVSLAFRPHDLRGIRLREAYDVTRARGISGQRG